MGPMKEHEKYKALGVDIFAGGFTVGVKKAGFEVVGHLEETDYAVKTARRNFPDLPIHIGVGNWPIDVLKAMDLDFVYGNPPCAAWSSAGITATKGSDRWRTDPRVDWTRRHFELLDKLRPKVWVWESVTNAFTKGREFVDELTKLANEQGYAVTYLLHNARWLGLPQIRRRFFMLCHRIDLNIPAPNWAPGPLPPEVLAECPASSLDLSDAYEAIRNDVLPFERLAEMEQGELLRDFWERITPPESWRYKENGHLIGRPSYGHQRLPVDKPARAIVGYSLIHPTENRYITTTEMKLLCGFPLDFEFEATNANAAASEIARGVCPTVANWLASHVRNALDQASGHGPGPSVTEIDYREPPAEDGVTVRKVRTPGAPKPAKASLQLDDAPAAPPRPPLQVSEKSGEYIRRLLKLETFTAGEILSFVREYFPATKSTDADVAFQRGRLKKEGTETRRVLQLADGSRKFAQ